MDVAIEATGIGHLRDRDVHELSLGERQLVLVAMAVAQQTPILILDEPTVHLDLQHQVAMMELLATLNRDRRMTVIAVLHDVSLAAHFFPRMVVLDRGRIVADGRPVASSPAPRCAPRSAWSQRCSRAWQGRWARPRERAGRRSDATRPRQLRAAAALLTRFPVRCPTAGLDPRPSPIIGAGLGALAAVPAALLAGIAPLLGAMLALGVIEIATGFLHLDGLADTADALAAPGSVAGRGGPHGSPDRIRGRRRGGHRAGCCGGSDVAIPGRPSRGRWLSRAPPHGPCRRSSHRRSAAPIPRDPGSGRGSRHDPAPAGPWPRSSGACS